MNKFYENADIFSVRSSADLTMSDIYLDHHGMNYIQLGHRTLSNVTQFGIKSTIENPTRVYLSAESPSRYLFYSTDVQTKHGTPMMVVVEREDSRGRVITASPHPNPFGQMIWESAGSLYSSYDEKSDLFYLSKGAAADGFVAREEPYIWYRAAEIDGSHIGVTVFDLRRFWAAKKADLVTKIAEFLGAVSGEIDLRIGSALGL